MITLKAFLSKFLSEIEGKIAFKWSFKTRILCPSSDWPTDLALEFSPLIGGHNIRARSYIMDNTGLPIFLNNSPSDRCDQIFWLIKNSDLNFCAQETPFGLNVQVKKKFVKKWETSQSFVNPSPAHSQQSNTFTYWNSNAVESEREKLLKKKFRI